MHCQCGCGEKTKIATRSKFGRGQVKGSPLRYIYGHSGRKFHGPDYEIDPNTGCWLWKKAKTEDGYGLVWFQGRVCRAHRHFYEQNIGPIPDGLEIDHLCRNRDCVNPKHLEPVTGKENTRRGANTRLSISEAREIKLWDKVAGSQRRDIAKAYGITLAHVINILAGRVWKDA